MFLRKTAYGDISSGPLRYNNSPKFSYEGVARIHLLNGFKEVALSF
jgi:hypothetical protein